MIEDREVLRSTLNAIGEGVVAVGLDGIVYDANPKFCQMIGCEEEKIVSRSIYDVLKISDVHETEDRETIIRRLMKKNQSIDFRDHYVFTSKNGNQYFIKGTSSCIKNNVNDCIGKVITLRDVTKEKEILDQIKYIGTHDYLTNLYNRRFVQETFIQMVEENQIPFGMLMIDLNGLKIINDAFGHHMGDIALKTTAKIFKDSFSSDCIISRIGGDEFIVLVPDISSEEQLIQYRQEVLDSLKNYTIYHMSISLAMGWVVIKNQNVDFDDVYKDVENEMYKHKLTESISVRNKAVNAIFMTLTEKYKSEKIHSERDRDIVEEIGIALKLKDHELNELKLSALFHDIGKISIPDGILNKPSSLTKDEYDIIKTHTESGYKILKAADEFSDLANHALFHHEWWDGSGYPKGIKGKDIPLFSRIISVADAFEAMTADRPYRSKMSTNEAIEELKKSAGTQFDPQIVKVFLKYLEKNPIADLN
jgi:diguanylate cyclase (GGDEF)-like protein/PAS domain S-box-containing protein